MSLAFKKVAVEYLKTKFTQSASTSILLNLFVLVILFLKLLSHQEVTNNQRLPTYINPVTASKCMPVNYLDTSYPTVPVKQRKPLRLLCYRRTPKWKTNSLAYAHLLWRQFPTISSLAERFPTINALVTSTTPSPRTQGYNSDSVDIAIANCCTRTLTINLRDMVKGSVKKIKPIRVKGIGGQFQFITHQGTIRWIVEDDNGVAHEILILGSLYGSTIGMRLFSPQHWAQQAKDHHPTAKVTVATTDYEAVTLITKTVPLLKSSNISIFQ